MLVACLMAGLVLPRSAAALAEVAGFETMVICRGDMLVTIAVAPGGTPVETALEDHGPCLAADLAPTVVAREVRATRFVPAPRGGPNVGPAPIPARWQGPPPKRGPPGLA